MTRVCEVAKNRHVKKLYKKQNMNCIEDTVFVEEVSKYIYYTSDSNNNLREGFREGEESILPSSVSYDFII
jgi:hypothetical protein